MLPESLDELISQDHPVRVIDAFVDSLDLGRLGFKKAITEATGRPPYAPAGLLKLYVYGYLNRVRSSRMIEREARRNMEVLWLVNRLAPTYKTIADFRKDHAKAIIAVCRAARAHAKPACPTAPRIPAFAQTMWKAFPVIDGRRPPSIARRLYSSSVAPAKQAVKNLYLCRFYVY